MLLNKKQMITPETVGIAREMAVHFTLRVSFLIVRQVVEHGQCISRKSDVHAAVAHVHPFMTSSSFSCRMLSISSMLPVDKYAITITGIIISLAGKPKIKAMRITPSKPIHLAKGSNNPAQHDSTLTSPIIIFAASQMISPAGAATAAALASTNNVLSKMERTIILPTCGLRYGGSSSVKDDGTPFKIVTESAFDTIKVMATPSRTKKVSNNAAATDRPIEPPAMKNIDIIAISVGNAPPS